MKIISWNVNGLRAVERKGDLEVFLNTHSPDIFLIQETKCKAEQVESLDEKFPQYQKFYHSAQKLGYSGVSIWVKKVFLEAVTNFTFSMDFPNNPVPEEGRVGQIDFCKNGKHISILGIYFPNGGKSPEAWQGKLIFYEAFLEHINQLRSQGKTVIWGGDVNCAHQPADLARPAENDGVIGFHPLERAWVSKVISEGWVDIWRKTFPEQKAVYSWWHVITRARGRNVGWRIDYLFCDEDSFFEVEEIFYLNDQMGSDHCPVGVRL